MLSTVRPSLARRIHAPLFLAAIGLSIVACADSPAAHAQVRGDSDQGETPHFKHERDVPLDPGQLVGTIGRLEVAPSGNLLALDGLANEVWLFSRDGNFIALLDPEPCHPGFSMMPIGIRFDQSGSVLLTSSGIAGYWFSSKGACNDGLDPSFRPPDNFELGPSREIAGFRFVDRPELCLFEPDGRRRWCVAVETERPVMANRVAIDGLSVAGDEIFHVLPSDYEVRVHSLVDGSILRTFPVEIAGANRIPPQDPSRFDIRKFGPAAIQSTRLTQIDHLRPNRVLVQYQHEGKWGYQIFNADGTRFAIYEGRNRQFLAVREGYAYDVIQPEADAAGEVPNPMIRVFRYVGP